PRHPRRTLLPYTTLFRSDLDTVFDAGKVIGLEAAPLREILATLNRMYCDAIGVEYMYIRTPERIEWIQQWLNDNDNRPNFTADEDRKSTRLNSSHVKSSY